MSNIAAYVVGDPHFPERTDGGAWAGVVEVRGDSIHALRLTIDLCLRDSVPLILPGDNFNGPEPEPGALTAVYNELRRLERQGLRTYYILGNHDRDRDWLAPLTGAVTNVSGTISHLPCGLSITGLSHIATHDAFYLAVKNVPVTDIGIYHQMWAELTKKGKTEFCLAKLPDHTLCVCGDIHSRAIRLKPEHSRNVLSPGALSPQSTMEFTDSIAYALDITPAGIIPREVQLKGREFLRVDIKSDQDAETAMNIAAKMKPNYDLPEEQAKPMLAIRVYHDTPGFEEAMIKLAEERDIILRMYTPDKANKDYIVPAAVCRSSLREAIMEWDDITISTEARELACKLINSPDHMTETIEATKPK